MVRVGLLSPHQACFPTVLHAFSKGEQRRTTRGRVPYVQTRRGKGEVGCQSSLHCASLEGRPLLRETTACRTSRHVNTPLTKHSEVALGYHLYISFYAFGCSVCLTWYTDAQGCLAQRWNVPMDSVDRTSRLVGRRDIHITVCIYQCDRAPSGWDVRALWTALRPQPMTH